jgi:hypothetical protein
VIASGAPARWVRRPAVGVARPHRAGSPAHLSGSFDSRRETRR